MRILRPVNKLVETPLFLYSVCVDHHFGKLRWIMEKSLTQECPEDLKPLFSQEENYLFSIKLRNDTREKEETIALSDKYFYTVGDTPRRHDLSLVHSVAHDWENEGVFNINLFSKLRKRMKSHPMGKGSLIGECILPESYSCSERSLRDEIVIIFNRTLRNHWHFILENNFIPPPEIYQYHTILTKINRKSKFQIRMIVLSTHKIYNIEVKLTPSCVLNTCKWTFSIGLFSYVLVYEDCDNAFTVIIRHADAKRLKRSYTFLVADREEREIIVHEIRRLYHNMLNQQLEERMIKKMLYSIWWRKASVFEY